MPNQFTEQFLALVDHPSPAVERATLAFIATRRDKDFVLLEVQLLLDGFSGEPPTPFVSDNIRAAKYRLSELRKPVAEVLAEIETGLLKLPHGEFVFPKVEGGGYRWEYDRFHPAGQQSRLEVMSVYGREREVLTDQRLLDWEVRAAETPFDSVIELANHFGLNFAQGSVRFEAAAPAIIAVDLAHQVNGTEASIGVRLAKGNNSGNAFLGYRVLSNKNVVARGRLSGHELEWHEEDKFLRGSAKIQVPNAAIVHCFAGYDGRAQSHGWIVDPSHHQNAKRSAYEVFDKDLKKMTEVLFRQPGPGKNARSDDFETAISWLLWMRGFSVSLLGTKSIPELKEGPDLLATTPYGHFVVVECTMGMLKEDNKLPKVVARATEIRERLEKSGSPHLKVLPAMVTSLPKSRVEAELERAAELGVYVVTREGIEDALQTSFLISDPETEFEQALASVAATTSIALEPATGQG